MGPGGSMGMGGAQMNSGYNSAQYYPQMQGQNYSWILDEKVFFTFITALLVIYCDIWQNALSWKTRYLFKASTTLPLHLLDFSATKSFCLFMMHWQKWCVNQWLSSVMSQEGMKKSFLRFCGIELNNSNSKFSLFKGHC